MADASWSISNDMAVFETKSSGSFIVSQNTYNSFSNDIRSIGSSVSGYHEYSHHFNTEIEARSIPLSLAREILATHSTPFGTNLQDQAL